MSDEYEKMNPEIREKWVNVLESGEYKKGTGVLRKTTKFSPVDTPDLAKDKFCCLGVLCDLYQKETGDGVWIGSTFRINSYDYSSTALPDAVKNWAGLSSGNPIVNFTRKVKNLATGKMRSSTATLSLSYINDDRDSSGRQRFTFKTIAKAIRANL